MNNKDRHNQRHLSISDRFFIEQEILQHSSFRYIGRALHKDPSTISKEIRRGTLRPLTLIAIRLLRIPFVLILYIFSFSFISPS